jgi:two-component system, response regulator FlrC
MGIVNKKERAKIILLVDDEPELRQLIAASLVIRGYDVVETESGNEALKVLGQSSPDLVLSDVRMPNGSGAELLKGARAQGYKIPIILMSGYTDLTQEQALQEGASALLSKPFNFKVVFDLITRILSPRAQVEDAKKVSSL